MGNLKPILKIDNFSGSGDGNVVYNEGFLPEVINGKSIITSGITSNTLIGDGTLYGTVDLKKIISFINLKKLDTNQTNFLLAANSSGEIFSSSLIPATSKIAKGLVHTTTGTNIDLFELSNGNVIYAGTQYIGLGTRGQATGGSDATLIDTTKNFDTLGYAVNDKVTNLNTGREYTITSITTTTNTNDTLNFTAAGSLVTAANDPYIIWNDNAFDMLSGVSAETWQGGSSTNWKRQIKQYADYYYILNGNYLSKLDSDLTTFTDNSKKLPVRYQAIAMAVNTNKILVSANYKDTGKLLLWNGADDGWNNILDFDFPINAITNYNSGWLFVSKGTLYYTDGYQIQIISEMDIIPDISRNSVGYLEPIYPNGLYYYQGKVYFANTYNDYNLCDYGVFMYDFKYGWSLIKQANGGDVIRLNGTPYCIGYCNYRSSLAVGGDDFINEIKSHRTYANAETSYSFIYYIDLPKEINILGIGLDILRPIKEQSLDSSIKQTTIAVNVGDGKRGLIDRVYNGTASGSGNDSLIKLDGTLFYGNEVGDEIIIKDSSSGNDLYGQRRYIETITNPGEATEQWTVDRNFSSDLGLADIRTIKVKKYGRNTVYSNQLNKEVKFFNPSQSVNSNKLFIEIVVFDSFDYTPMPISISKIKIYGNN